MMFIHPDDFARLNQFAYSLLGLSFVLYVIDFVLRR
jgi:hypothetical protein